jgi:hypothetical protein
MHCCFLSRQPDRALYCTVSGMRREYEFGPPGGLWKSVDDAKTWIEVTKPEPTIWWPNGYAVDPKDHNRILLTEATASRKPCNGGLWETRDRGKIWRKILSPPDLKIEKRYMHAVDVQFMPEDPGRILLKGDYFRGMWYSPDNGKAWKKLSLDGFPANPYFLVRDPGDPETLYTGGNCTSLWRGPVSAFKVD